MASEIKVDTISEKTSANGVTIDGVSLKDSKIATANSVDSDAYVDASIDNAHLADNAVDTAEIADNAVTLAKMDGLARGKLIYGDASGDPAALAVGGADEVLTHDGTDLAWAAASSTTLRPNALPIIINGNMAISQRGTAITDETTSGFYRVDRMNVGLSSIGQFRLSQESLASGNAFDAGFTKAFRIDCAVEDASPASSDIGNMTYKLEGNTVQAFKKGTSNAETFTLAFWVKSSETGTAQVNLIDGDNSRMCSATYVISSADTWEHKVLNYAADTTGAFDNDNAKSLEIEFALDAGSDFTSGAVPTAWEATSDTDRSVSDLALQDNTSNDWAITGLQLEVGTYTSSTIPPFQHESFGDNFLRCCRYYQRSYEYGTAYASNTGNGAINYVEGVDNGRFFIPFRNGSMRAAPNMTIQRKNGGGTDQGQRNDFGSTYLDVDGISGKLNGVEFLQNGTQSGQGYTFVSQFLADAEL